MAKKLKDEAVKADETILDAPKVEETLPVESDEQLETKEVEVVVGKELNGTEKKETQKLVAKQVFEPMQGQFRTVWTKE
jgi:hypothetical protein